MAMTTPWWRSFTLRLRVPKSTVNSASPTATQKAACAEFSGSLPGVTPGSALAKIDRDRVTD